MVRLIPAKFQPQQEDELELTQDEEVILFEDPAEVPWPKVCLHARGYLIFEESQEGGGQQFTFAPKIGTVQQETFHL